MNGRKAKPVGYGAPSPIGGGGAAVARGGGAKVAEGGGAKVAEGGGAKVAEGGGAKVVRGGATEGGVAKGVAATPGKRFGVAVTVPVLLGLTTVAWAFPWDKDMVDQPSAKPQESEAPMDAAGVPVIGGETMPAPTTEAGMFEAKDAAVLLENPIPATPESVAFGQYLYEINCMVCHGPEGRGDGPVGLLLATSPVDMNDAYTQDQGDGQLFFTITRGRVTMPYYRDALSVEERWHVINYMRATFRFPSQVAEPAAPIASPVAPIGEPAAPAAESAAPVGEPTAQLGATAAQIGE